MSRIRPTLRRRSPWLGMLLLLAGTSPWVLAIGVAARSGFAGFCGAIVLWVSVTVGGGLLYELLRGHRRAA